jgi:Na+/glutamate symporter
MSESRFSTHPPPVLTVRTLKRLQWAMRFIAFACLFAQANFDFFDASWKRTSWLYTAAGAVLALIVHAWAGWRLKRTQRTDDS